MATGICYTQSGTEKRYESSLLSISPNRVKLVDFDGISCEPYLPYIFTSSNKPPEMSLEDGTAMYSVGLRNIDPYDIDITTYLSYTPPDGYELVSEDHKNDTGVEEYYVSKYFYTEPFTVYYGTAGKTINDIGLNAGKWFYYKKIDKPNIYRYYKVVFTISGGSLHCRCDRVTDIPGTNSGNVNLSINITIGENYADEFESFTFSWIMKNGINESKLCRYNKYLGSGFTTQNTWEQDNVDGTKTYYTFSIDTSSILGQNN